VNHISQVIYTCLILTVLSCLWLCFIIFCPKRWAALVDKENNYWVAKGVLSTSLAEKVKRLEKGVLVKLMAVFLVVLTAFLLIVSVHIRNRINPPRKGPMRPPVMQPQKSGNLAKPR
jgi:hypothetical protein